MTDLMFDFSALSRLNCARAYQFTCVQGVDNSSDDTTFGSAFHKFLEARALKEPFTLELIQGIAKDFKLPPALATELLTAASTFEARRQIPEPIIDIEGRPLVEWKFHFPIMTIRDYRIILSGTLDIGSPAVSYIQLTDYKTTKHSTGLDKAIFGYTMSLQLPFYIYIFHKYLAHILPSPFDDYARQLKIRANYTLICRSFNPVRFEDSGPVSLTFNELPAFEEILLTLINKAVTIHERETLAPPEGMAYYQTCVNCNYKHICLTKDEDKILSAIANLPKRIYDPSNFR